MKRGGRTVMVLREPERVSRPYRDETITITTKCMLHHILDAVRLRRAPDHDVEPGLRLGGKEIRAKGGEVWPAHDAARCGTLELVVLAAGGLGWPRGAEEESAIEVQDEELACGL
jgi:hypothetical protein